MVEKGFEKGRKGGRGEGGKTGINKEWREKGRWETGVRESEEGKKETTEDVYIMKKRRNNLKNE